MAIVRIDPEDFEKVNTVQVFTDAGDNRDAVLEIEAWAAQHGFVRTSEYWLGQMILETGRRVFRGVCYRMTPELTESLEQDCQMSLEAVARQPEQRPETDNDG